MPTHKQAAQRRRVKKVLAWAFWAANLAIIVGFWANGSGRLFAGAALGEQVLIFGRICGLLATFCALTQFVLMGRVGWLEPIFGLDRLAIFHRRNGVATLSLLLTHSFLVTLGYSLLRHVDIITQTLFQLGSVLVVLAVTAEALFVLTVGMSIYIVRKHLTFETWYAVHIFNYLAIVLVFWHQIFHGYDLVTQPVFMYYWIGLYVFTLANVLVWRFSRPLWRYMRFKFTVQKVVPETPTATSIYITGRRFTDFKAKGGQFVMVRFLTKGLWAQEHPFSLSMMPSGQHIRLTIRQLGDFTNQVPFIKAGTKVMVSGPYGAFTHERQTTNKVLYIAGGIGITPIRAMLEERSRWPHHEDVVLLYGNRTLKDTVFLKELTTLASQLKMPFLNILSEQKNYKGETGYIDKDKIARLVPDVAKRDIFLCGPPPMMAIIRASLIELGVPEQRINYERFALHKG